MPRQQVGDRRPATTIGHVDHIDTSHHLEELTRNVAAGAGASRRKTDFSRATLGMRDELGNRLSRKRWIHHHDEGASDDAGDWRDIAEEVVVKLVIERRVYRIVRTD